MNSTTKKPRSRGRPKLEDKNGRELIKQAALIEFSKCGFNGARIDSIAEAAGVAKPLVYYHFTSKSQLWEKSVSEAFEAFQAQVQLFFAAFERLPAEQVIDDFAQGIVRFSAENPWLVRISMDETRQGGERASWLKETYMEPTHQMATEMVLTVLKGQVSPKRAREIARHAVPMIFGAITFPYVNADIVASIHNVDVHSESYVVNHAYYVAVIMRSLLASATSS